MNNLTSTIDSAQENSITAHVGKPHIGDALAFARLLPDESVNCVVTSPPYYGLRAYLPDSDPNKAQEIGLEDTPAAYVARLVELFREVRRVLRKDGTCWVVIGDSWVSSPPGNSNSDSSGLNGAKTSAHYSERLLSKDNRGKRFSGLPAKNLLMIPARVAIALQDDGWILRDEIVWHKPNPMPASVTDRTTRAHEMVYLLTKAPRYYYDAAAIAEPAVSSDPSHEHYRANGKSDRRVKNAIVNKGKPSFGFGGMKVFNERNRRSVWTVPTAPTSEAHFATFPPDLIKPMILAGCPEGGIVYDPFLGSGTTAFVAEVLGRRWVGSELNPDYLPIILKRLEKHGGALEWLPMFAGEGGAK